MKALVVDDSAVACRVLWGILQHDCGFNDHVEAEDGIQAVEIAGEQEFDLILLDWNMPKMNGIDVVRALRDREVTTAIIMVTSETDESHVIQAFDAGADNYITKPFEPATLSLKIRQALYL